MSSDGALQLVTALLCLVTDPLSSDGALQLVTALLCLVSALSSW